MIDQKRIEEVFTSTQWRFVFLSEDDCPSTLIEALKKKLPHVDPQSWERRLAVGGAYVNGARTALDAPLAKPCKIEYYEPKFDFESLSQVYPEWNSTYVLFEDDELLVVHKPAGLPTMPAKEQQHYSLKRFVEEYLKAKAHLPSRLDVSTEGVVLISKTPRMNCCLQRAYERKGIEKRYLLQVSEEVLWAEKQVEEKIGRDPHHPVLRRVVSEGGKAASTHFTFVGVGEGGSILEARPLTGRTHQIRVHAQFLGLPIIGDGFYGGAKSSNLRLLSYCLRFPYPGKKEMLEVYLPERLFPSWLKDACAFPKVRNYLVRGQR